MADYVRATQHFATRTELRMKTTCVAFLGWILAFGPALQGPKTDGGIEIDVGKILWQRHSSAQKCFGRVINVLPPRIPGEGWEFQYARGNGTVGTKHQVLMVVYRFADKPHNHIEALRKVGLPTNVPPLDFGTSYIWPSHGNRIRTIRFRERTLNRVILAKDFSEITVDGHEPGTY